MDDERRRLEQRFTLLYDVHSPAVRAYAWRRGPDIADDVVAETFTIAWQRLDDVPDDPLPWLIGVARKVRLNQLRGERRRHEREAHCASEDVVPSFAGDVEARAALRAALQRLSERDREILLLAAWERLDGQALAAVLECSRTAAAVRLFRARRRLAAAMAEVEAGPCRFPTDARGRLLDES